MILDLAKELWPVIGAVETETKFGYAGETDVLEDLFSRVILYNDDHHTFDEVIVQVSKATGCSGFEAEGVAWEVHTRGLATVFEGDLFNCLKVSSILEEIALHTQVMT